MTAGVSVKGLDELKSNLAALAADLQDIPMQTIAAKGESLARGFAPKRTGRLARSIVGVTTENRASIAVGVSYGSMVNYGTRYIKANHFLQKADAALNSTVYAELDKAIDQLIVEKGLS